MTKSQVVDAAGEIYEFFRSVHHQGDCVDWFRADTIENMLASIYVLIEKNGGIDRYGGRLDALLN